MDFRDCLLDIQKFSRIFTIFNSGTMVYSDVEDAEAILRIHLIRVIQVLF